MNLYKVGCNFDFELIKIVKDLNEKYEGRAKVVEFFGSDAEHEELSARPGWRLPKLSRDEFARYIKESREAGILFNYTMNSIQPYGSKVEMVKHKQEIQEYVKWLEEIGVYHITIANPMLALFIREVSNINLEASCILHFPSTDRPGFLFS